MVTEGQDFVVVNTEFMRHIDAEALRSHLQREIEDQEDVYSALTCILKQVKLQNAVNIIILQMWVLTPM